jgi:UDP-N-acetylglucosamine/UDP-N-acetylgalactosamine 4-epimerase
MHLETIVEELRVNPKTWLITGVAGFIGSNLLEYLLNIGQTVIGLDNFSTGKNENLYEVRDLVNPGAWSNFTLIKGDIREYNVCLSACAEVDIVLHQAALGSVPRSLEDPIATNQSNVDGFLNMLVAARDTNIDRFIYAASSSTYGDHPGLPKTEDKIGKPLSPYAVTKLVNELYADVFANCYKMQTIGLRYFNVFGKRQDPNGPYAAVIPIWINAIANDKSIVINGDGETSRDFCYIENVIQANLLAALCNKPSAINQVYNIAFGKQTTLNQLFQKICKQVQLMSKSINSSKPVYTSFRAGDVRHSLADISKASKLLGYSPKFDIDQGLEKTIAWYMARAK